MTDAFPLKWPANRPRKPAGLRKSGKFSVKAYNGNYNAAVDITVASAIKRIQNELDMIGARYPVISSNVELRLDGLPRSDRREPDDPGVALYFDLAGKPHCLPCDTYNRVAQNMAAIAAHMEKARAIERYGVASLAEMFAGFVALPAPGQAESQKWWRVMGFDPHSPPSEELIRMRYRELAKKVADSEPALAELNVARDEALKIIRAVA